MKNNNPFQFQVPIPTMISDLQKHITNLPQYSDEQKLYIRTDRYIDALRKIIEVQEEEITHLKKKLKKK
jgi:hypothetical protein